MPRTKFSTGNAQFSHAAHLAAREQVYPCIFGLCEDIEFEDVAASGTLRCKILDQELGVDCIVRVPFVGNGFFSPMAFTVQERWRRPYALADQKITITAYNNASGTVSELFKIAAELFVYGWYDEEEKEVVGAICFDVPRLLYWLTTEAREWDWRENDKAQTYLELDTFDIYEAGAVIWASENVRLDFDIEAGSGYRLWDTS